MGHHLAGGTALLLAACLALSCRAETVTPATTTTEIGTTGDLPVALPLRLNPSALSLSVIPVEATSAQPSTVDDFKTDGKTSIYETSTIPEREKSEASGSTLKTVINDEKTTTEQTKVPETTTIQILNETNTKSSESIARNPGENEVDFSNTPSVSTIEPLRSTEFNVIRSEEQTTTQKFVTFTSISSEVSTTPKPNLRDSTPLSVTVSAPSFPLTILSQSLPVEEKSGATSRPQYYSAGLTEEPAGSSKPEENRLEMTSTESQAITSAVRLSSTSQATPATEQPSLKEQESLTTPAQSQSLAEKSDLSPQLTSTQTPQRVSQQKIQEQPKPLPQKLISTPTKPPTASPLKQPLSSPVNVQNLPKPSGGVKKGGGGGKLKRYKKKDNGMGSLIYIPFMIQAQIVPMMLMKLKFLVLKAITLGKLALLILGLNLLRNAMIGYNNVEEQYEHDSLAAQHYGYNGEPEYGSWVNRRMGPAHSDPYQWSWHSSGQWG